VQYSWNTHNMTPEFVADCALPSSRQPWARRLVAPPRVLATWDTPRATQSFTTERTKTLPHTSSKACMFFYVLQQLRRTRSRLAHQDLPHNYVPAFMCFEVQHQLRRKHARDCRAANRSIIITLRFLSILSRYQCIRTQGVSQRSIVCNNPVLQL
jgi:hypothetical protein